jgi:CMP-N-acetylneuraminic acid synthetase
MSARVVAIVPAKARSQRVPGKNLRVVAGKPLLSHILEALKQCKRVDDVYLDSESAAIQELGRQHNVKIINRPATLASDSTNGNDLLMFESNIVRADLYIQTFATNPLLRAATVDAAVEKLLSSPEHDSLFAVTREYGFFWDQNGPVNHDPRRLPRTQDLAPFFRETTGLYIIRRDALMSRKCRIGNNPICFEIDPIEATDIDYEHDLHRAEALMAQRHSPEKVHATVGAGPSQWLG